MAKHNVLTVSVFGAQVLCFGVMFSMLKFISQTCVDLVPGQEPNANSHCPPGQTKFGRPMLSAFMMVSSMTLGFLYYFPFRHNKPDCVPVTRKSLLYIVLPSFLDCCCALLLLVGSKPIPMALALVLKGTRFFFSCVLAIFMLKKKIRGYNWAGVAIALLGASLAGLSAILNSQEEGAGALHSTGEVIMGIALVVTGEFFRSLMVTIQEIYMKKKICDPAFLMSLQGIYGGVFITIALLLAWLVIPGSDIGGSYENMKVTFQQAGESTTITVMLCIVPMFSAAGFICSALVSYLLSAVYNAMASVIMTALVWSLELIAHAINPTIGTTWAKYSPLQLAGFLFVILGVLVYDGTLIKFPRFFDYDTPSAPTILESKMAKSSAEYTEGGSTPLESVNVSTDKEGTQALQANTH